MATPVHATQVAVAAPLADSPPATDPRVPPEWTGASPHSQAAFCAGRAIFWGFHGPLGLVYWAGVSWQAVALCLASYYVRMFFVTGQ